MSEEYRPVVAVRRSNCFVVLDAPSAIAAFDVIAFQRLACE